MEIVHAFGVGSARHRAGLPVLQHTVQSVDGGRAHLFDVPIGTCLARWDVERRQVIRLQQLHDDLISCMIRSPVGDLNATCSYAGEVSFWTADWRPLGSLTVPKSRLMHAAWSLDGTRFAVTCVCDGGGLAVLDVRRPERPVLLCALDGPYSFVEWTPSGRVWAVRQGERAQDPSEAVLISIGRINCSDAVTASVSSASAASPSPPASSSPPSPSSPVATEVTLVVRPLADTQVRMCAADGHAGKVAVALADRTVRILDMESHQTEWVFAGGPAGSVQTMLFDRGVVTVPMGGGRLGVFAPGHSEPALVRYA